MGDLFSPMHVILIAFVVLLLFGGKKLPQLARSAGTSVRELRSGLSGEGNHDKKQKAEETHSESV